MSWLFALGFLPLLGICRHRAGDPACSSSAAGQARAAADSARYSRQQKEKAEGEVKRLQKLLDAPDPALYEVVDIEQIGNHLVMKARYPHCPKCFYEGTKVMVFLNCTYKDAVMWRRVDPHFGDPKLKTTQVVAPHPSARFPASDEGWKDAIEYAQRKA
jgi:hypothetical protein